MLGAAVGQYHCSNLHCIFFLAESQQYEIVELTVYVAADTRSSISRYRTVDGWLDAANAVMTGARKVMDGARGLLVWRWWNGVEANI